MIFRGSILSDNIAFIALGSNLSNPITQIQQAVVHLQSHQSIEVIKHSSLYQSSPMGPQDQPDFINSVAKINTSLDPLDLLSTLKSIENEMGRVKGERWGARVIDLDILLYEQLEMDLEQLTIPHIGLSERNFVLVPLLEIEPELEITGKGSIQSLINDLENRTNIQLTKL